MSRQETILLKNYLKKNLSLFIFLFISTYFSAVELLLSPVDFGVHQSSSKFYVYVDVHIRNDVLIEQMRT